MILSIEMLNYVLLAKIGSGRIRVEPHPEDAGVTDLLRTWGWKIDSKWYLGFV